MRYYLGNVYFHARSSDPEKESMRRRLAETHFKESVRLLPDHAESLTHLAILHEERKEMYEAEALLRRALQSEPNIFHRTENLAVVLIKTNRLCEAKALFDKAAANSFDAPYYMDIDTGMIDQSGNVDEDGSVKSILMSMIRDRNLSCR